MAGGRGEYDRKKAAAVVMTAADFARYAQAARQRLDDEKQKLAERRRLAWQLARKAADLLRSKYAATRVVVYGSLTRPELFHAHSDVDIAVWGLQPEDSYKAMGDVYDIGGALCN